MKNKLYIVIPFSRDVQSFLIPGLTSILDCVKRNENKHNIPNVHVCIMNDVPMTSMESRDLRMMPIIDDLLRNGIHFIEYKIHHKDRSNIAGHYSRNFFMEVGKNKLNQDSLIYASDNDNIDPDSFIYFLDDDNILHPNFFNMVNKLIESEKDGIVFSQMMKNGNSRLIAGKIEVGFVDTAMFLLKYSLIGNTRFDESDYCADGKFIKDIYSSNPNKIIIDKEYGCYYNFLR